MTCRICGGQLHSLGSTAFEDTQVEYLRCTDCQFLCCPEMLTWSPEVLGAKVYNEDYIKYDPDYVDKRPRDWSTYLKSIVAPNKLKNISHLDYGCGQGLLVDLLKGYKWNSTGYDPYSSPSKPTGTFNLITAIEVFEHALDIDALFVDIKSMLARNGAVLFTTLLSTGNETIDWWYIMPRNGHIGILSAKSLKILAQRHGLFFDSIDHNKHVLQPARSNLSNILGVDLIRKNKQ